MNARLRTRAAGIQKQLDSGTGYRDEIERELHKRLGSGAPRVPGYDSTTVGPSFSAVTSPARPSTAPDSGVRCTCGAINDTDARFCKACGSRLQAA
jgi:hypothetical protein